MKNDLTCGSTLKGSDGLIGSKKGSNWDNPMDIISWNGKTGV